MALHGIRATDMALHFDKCKELEKLDGMTGSGACVDGRNAFTIGFASCISRHVLSLVCSRSIICSAFPHPLTFENVYVRPPSTLPPTNPSTRPSPHSSHRQPPNRLTLARSTIACWPSAPLFTRLIWARRHCPPASPRYAGVSQSLVFSKPCNWHFKSYKNCQDIVPCFS